MNGEVRLWLVRVGTAQIGINTGYLQQIFREVVTAQGQRPVVIHKKLRLLVVDHVCDFGSCSGVVHQCRANIIPNDLCRAAIQRGDLLCSLFYLSPGPLSGFGRNGTGRSLQYSAFGQRIVGRAALEFSNAQDDWFHGGGSSGDLGL